MILRTIINMKCKTRVFSLMIGPKSSLFSLMVCWGFYMISSGLKCIFVEISGCFSFLKRFLLPSFPHSIWGKLSFPRTALRIFTAPSALELTPFGHQLVQLRPWNYERQKYFHLVSLQYYLYSTYNITQCKLLVLWWDLLEAARQAIPLLIMAFWSNC